jgi:hypothetical protein
MVEAEFSFSSGPVRLTGTLSRGSAEGVSPALVLLSGSGAHDRDETVCGHTPFKRMAGFFSRRGYAVLRYDDRGVGASSGDAERTEFDDSVADARAAFWSLACTAGIDMERISLLGHSEGGLVAAKASQGLPAQAVLMLAGPAMPLEPLLHRMNRAISQEAGATPRQLEHEQRMNEAVFAVSRGPATQEAALAEAAAILLRFLRSWPDVPPFDEDTARGSAETMARIVCAPAYRSLLRQRPHEILAAVDKPLLALYGGKDLQVPGAENLAAFRQATVNNPSAEGRLFDGLNHLFQPARTGSLSEYEALPPGPADVVLEAMAAWLDALPPARR